jgi:hypothetical protein
VRLKKADFRARVNGSLKIEFSDSRLTTYAGLELVSRYVRLIGLRSRLDRCASRLGIGGDVRFASMVLLIVAMLLVGARRLRHVAFLRGDPLVRRFAGLERVPDRTTLARTLKRFDRRGLAELEALSDELVARALKARKLSRLTLDFDGSVLSTGMDVERAFRGFNPHQRKKPSYYPLMGTIAQTGHVIAHRNRSGDVHDSKGAAQLIRETVLKVRSQGWFSGTIELRADAAFFQRDVLEAVGRLDVEYAIKVPLGTPWLNARAWIAAEGPAEWTSVDRAGRVEGRFLALPIPPWGRAEQVAVFRKRVNHKSRKDLQLDLFDPDDGSWEYSAVATNKKIGLIALWHFANGRGVQEKTFAELKSGYAFASIPTDRYGANSAWQKLNVLTHNLVTSFQLETTASAKPRSRKHTTLFRLESIRSLRFTWLGKAALLLRPAGRLVLRLAKNPATETVFARISDALARAA